MRYKVTTRILFAALAFCVAAGLGLFCAAAGGVKWGTPDAGAISVGTMIPAAFAAIMVFMASGDNWS